MCMKRIYLCVILCLWNGFVCALMLSHLIHSIFCFFSVFVIVFLIFYRSVFDFYVLLYSFRDGEIFRTLHIVQIENEKGDVCMVCGEIRVSEDTTSIIRDCRHIVLVSLDSNNSGVSSSSVLTSTWNNRETSKLIAYYTCTLYTWVLGPGTLRDT